MGTIFRAFGMRFAIYSNEHFPPHVHIYAGGGEAKFILLPDGDSRLDWSRRMTVAQLRQASMAIKLNRGLIDDAWSTLNG